MLLSLILVHTASCLCITIHETASIAAATTMTSTAITVSQRNVLNCCTLLTEFDLLIYIRTHASQVLQRSQVEEVDLPMREGHTTDDDEVYSNV
jgi:hypothetical protein